MKKLGIRLDVGKSIGAGHLMRCSALADAMSALTDMEIVFICRNPIGGLVDYPIIYINAPYITDKTTYAFPSIIDEVEDMKKIISNDKIDCLIVDHYGANDDYFYALRGEVKCLGCVDDGISRSIPADIIINGNIYGVDADYSGIHYQLTGSKYMLMRSMFQGVKKRTNKNRVQEVYITSGGADPCGFCQRIAEILANTFVDVHIHIIIGNDFSDYYVEKLAKLGTILHRNANMKECMEASDLFISGAGSTLYELAACGVPSISFILAEDQRVLGQYMHRIGTTYVCGDFEKMDKESFIIQCGLLFDDKEMRDAMSTIGQQTIDGEGARNTALELNKILENI